MPGTVTRRESATYFVENEILREESTFLLVVAKAWGVKLARAPSGLARRRNADLRRLAFADVGVSGPEADHEPRECRDSAHEHDVAHDPQPAEVLEQRELQKVRAARVP